MNAVRLSWLPPCSFESMENIATGRMESESMIGLSEENHVDSIFIQSAIFSLSLTCITSTLRPHLSVGLPFSMLYRSIDDTCYDISSSRRFHGAGQAVAQFSTVNTCTFKYLRRINAKLHPCELPGIAQLKSRRRDFPGSPRSAARSGQRNPLIDKYMQLKHSSHNTNVT